MEEHNRLTIIDSIKRPKSSFVIFCLLLLVKIYKAINKTKITIPFKCYEKIITYILKISKDGNYVLDKLNRYSIPIPHQRFRHTTNIEVHSMVSHLVLPYYLLTVKTLQYYSQINFPFVVHDDGSLTEIDVDQIRRNVVNVIILPFEESTKKVCHLIRNYPCLVKYRQKKHKNKINLISTIDIPYLSNSQNIFYLDGDILFFRKPLEICNWVLKPKQRKSVLFMTDRENGYALSEKLCQKYFNVGYIDRFNMGILCFSKKLFDLPMINHFFSVMSLLKKHTVMLRDQTYWMIYLQKRHQPLKRLNNQYIIPYETHGDNKTICRHYISPIREKIYLDAIVLLFKLRLLNV